MNSVPLKRIQGKTKSGFEFELDNDIFNDWEFVDLLSEISDGNTAKLPKLLKLLLGSEQTEKLRLHCMSDNGKVPADRMFDELTEILTSPSLKK